MEAQAQENANFNSSTVTRQRKKTIQENCRLLRVAPLICAITGCVLTVVGNVGSLKSCQIAGPIVMAVGGLFLLFMTFWRSRQERFTAETSTSCEEGVNTMEQNVGNILPEEGANFQLGPIHDFEVWIPSEPFGPEMVPPLYEEAVSDNNTERLEANSVIACDEQEFNLNQIPSKPPSYEQGRVNTQDV